MSAFEHVTTLLSFVYALALTHLLARIAELVVARDGLSGSPASLTWSWLFGTRSPSAAR